MCSLMRVNNFGIVQMKEDVPYASFDVLHTEALEAWKRDALLHRAGTIDAEGVTQVQVFQLDAPPQHIQHPRLDDPCVPEVYGKPGRVHQRRVREPVLDLQGDGEQD